MSENKEIICSKVELISHLHWLMKRRGDAEGGKAGSEDGVQHFQHPLTLFIREKKNSMIA